MTDEVSRLGEEVEALRLECSELRAMLTAQQQTDSGDYDDYYDVAFRAPGTPDDKRPPTEIPPRRPFDIWYDPVQEEWKIYLPEGCVKVEGEDAEYEGETDNDDVATITPAATLYAHVKRLSGGSSSYSFSVDSSSTDSSSTDSDAICDFKVASFDSYCSEIVAQHVVGTVVIGGGSASAPGCWDIQVDDESSGSGSGPTGSWVNQYLMLGSEILATDVDDDPATHAGKFVAVQITDGASGAISIQEYATAADMAAATNDPTKFTIPLGKLNAKGTAYAIDMRIIPHASAWDAYTAPAQQSGGAS